MAKVPVSFEWLSGCSGCELSLVDLHERLLKVLEEIDIVRLPILIDEKGYPNAAVGIITGALRTEHDVECAKKMRETCGKILAFGTCAVFGGPQGSGYAHTTGDLEKTAFVENPTTETHFVPDEGLPKLLAEGVMPLDAAIDVDLYLPGCPPHAYYVFEALRAVLHGGEPEFGPHNVCFKCPRHMEQSDVTHLRRVHEGPLEDGKCFLSQGVLCMGSATLDRCLAPCPERGAPCTGCGGPSESVVLEPNRDIRTEIANRVSMMTKIPRDQVVHAIEKQARTYYAYAMASPVFRQKPTFLLRRWIAEEGTRR
ncbi:MAG: methyl viologen-reducing hydrogenase [Polyangiaceae bacterium]|jgi:F420-non-reducing hydrogenase small subunit